MDIPYRRRPARHLITRLLGERWERWKNVKPENLIKFIILLRITPGIPIFLQNYVLGLLSVPYLTYMAISIPITSIFIVGFVLTGGAVFEGNIGVAFLGFTVLVAATILLNLLRSKIRPGEKVRA